jgi:hypothetical protein
MVDAAARLALALTLQDVAEYLNSPLSCHTAAEAGHLLAVCIPVLDGLGRPYTPDDVDRCVPAIEPFTLRVDATPETEIPLLPATLVLTLTDIADYLVHLSRGGQANYAIETYISAQCFGLLDQIGVRQPRRNPPS